MALGNFTQPGAINTGATDFASRRTHNLVLFAGEVLTAFQRKTSVANMVKSKTIPYGKSANFVATGRLGAAFHTPGDSIIDDTGLQALNVVKRPVYLDDTLVVPTFVNEQEENMAEYDVRAPISTQVGEALAVTYDQWAHITIGKAARWTAANIGTGGLNGNFFVADMGTLGEGGYVSVNMTTADNFYAGIVEAAALMDAKDIPQDNRYLPLTPADYWFLLNNKDLINRDYGGMGIYQEGVLTRAAGFTVYRTNNLPQTNITSTTLGAGGDNVSSGQYYGGNFNRVDATNGYITTAFHTDCIAMLYLRGIASELWYDPEYQGTFIMSKVQAGTNVIRPECTVELNTAVSQPNLTITP